MSPLAAASAGAVVGAIALAVLLLPAGARGGNAVVTEVADVTRVTLGDTLEAGGRQLRLHGIDAPESDQRHGPAAAAALRERIRGERVQIEALGRDRYGRVLAVVYHDGRNINRWLVRRGHAWSYDGHAGAPGLEGLEREARQADRGLWAHDHPMPPWQWRERMGSGPDSKANAEAGARDCTDLDSQAEAQRLFEMNQPGDPHGLDSDNDGEACESLP